MKVSRLYVVSAVLVGAMGLLAGCRPPVPAEWTRVNAGIEQGVNAARIVSVEELSADVLEQHCGPFPESEDPNRFEPLGCYMGFAAYANGAMLAEQNPNAFDCSSIPRVVNAYWAPNHEGRPLPREQRDRLVRICQEARTERAGLLF